MFTTSPATMPSPSAGARTEGDDCLAGGHADADVEVEARISLVQLLDRIADGESGANGALRVVLVRGGGPEDAP